MADTKLIDLPAGTAPDGTELFYAVQNGADVKLTSAQVGNIPSSTSLNGQLLYNDNGVIDGTDGVFYDKTTNRLGIGAAPATTPQAALDLRTDAIGATASVSSGVYLENTTLAAASAQQVSPSIVWEGQGWATTPVTSRSIRFQSYVLPVQGTTNPSGTWALQSSVNNAAFANVVTITSAGALTATGALVGTSFTSSATANALAISSSTTQTNASLAAIASGSAPTPQAELLFAGATNVHYRVLSRGSTATTLTTSSSYGSFILGSQGGTTSSTGTHALIAQQVINPIVIVSGGAAVTNTASLYINGASTTTVTGKNYSLWSTGLNRLDGGNAFVPTTVSAAGAYVITDADYIIYVNATAGAVTITLPVTIGRSFIIKKIDASINTVTLTPASGSIEGAANLVLSTLNARTSINTDGTNYYVIG